MISDDSKKLKETKKLLMLRTMQRDMMYWAVDEHVKALDKGSGSEKTERTLRRTLQIIEDGL